MSTVECERVFSGLGNILTKKRNRLKISKINDLLFINRNGPKINQFDFNRAIENWKNEKPRRHLCKFICKQFKKK